MSRDLTQEEKYYAGLLSPEEIEEFKRSEEEKQNLIDSGLRARNVRRQRDRARIGGHGTNFTPKKKKRRK